MTGETACVSLWVTTATQHSKEMCDDNDQYIKDGMLVTRDKVYRQLRSVTGFHMGRGGGRTEISLPCPPKVYMW